TTIAIHRGTKVRKCHTSRRDAFRSINAQPIARVQDQKITMLTDNYTPRDKKRTLTLKPQFNEKAALIKFYPNMNPAIIEWHMENGYKGIILEGTGLGHIGNYCFNAIKKAIDNNIIIAMTSQCIWGRVNMNVYDTGRDLLALGVIPLEDMLPETALVKLMWTLAQTQNPEEAKQMLKTNIAGEITPRTTPEEAKTNAN
ncbi:MAG: asparaginase domain-containing protein, partial [Candidatus Bathyarchaeia archaeon]